MSDAIRCDRCGVYELQMVDGKNPYHRDWIQIYSNENDRHYALCPLCAKKFNKFIEGGTVK